MQNEDAHIFHVHALVYGLHVIWPGFLLFVVDADANLRGIVVIDVEEELSSLRENETALFIGVRSGGVFCVGGEESSLV